GIEIGFCNLTCSAALCLVASLHGFECGDSVFDSPEGHQPFAYRQPAAEARVLRDHRTPRREITHASIAEPAALRFDVPALGDAKLASGLLNEPLILRRRPSDFSRIDQIPPGTRECLQVPDFACMNGHREAKSDR